MTYKNRVLKFYNYKKDTINKILIDNGYSFEYLDDIDIKNIDDIFDENDCMSFSNKILNQIDLNNIESTVLRDSDVCIFCSTSCNGCIYGARHEECIFSTSIYSQTIGVIDSVVSKLDFRLVYDILTGSYEKDN